MKLIRNKARMKLQHEVRTSVGIIWGYLELMEGNCLCQNSEILLQFRQASSKVRKNCERLIKATDDITK